MFENLLDYLKKNLPKKITKKGYNNYEIFGKQVEKEISDTIEEYLDDIGINYKSNRAKNKNAFPDLELKIAGLTYAFEHKAGICNKKGISINTASNDLGTLNMYPKKIKTYSDNIYCTFLKYSVLKNNTIKIENIFFDKIYTFIGKGNGFPTQLQYREKDGNLRPKSWKDMENRVIYFKNIEEFQLSLYQTNQYRSSQIIIKHFNNLDDNSKEKILNQINNQNKKNTHGVT